MNRKQQAAEIRSTWMVMREPADVDGNRHTRRARLAQYRRSVRAAESSEERRPPAPRDSAASTEGG